MTRRAALLPAALICIPAAFAAGGIAARAALRAAPRAVATDLAQPLPVVTAWHAFGTQMWTVLALCIALATIATVVAVSELRRRPTGRFVAWGVFGAAAAALAFALAWPVVFSSDVYAYAAYGDLAARGIDPYVRNAPPAGDVLAASAAWQWGGATPPCVYGPAFVAIARAVVGAAANCPAWMTLLAFRVLSSIAFLLAAAALYLALRGPRAGAGRLAATAAFVLNPLAIWCAAEGHNDALMLFVAVGGAALARRHAALLGGVVVALSSLLKAPGVAVGAALALRGGPARSRSIALGIAGGAVIAFGVGLPTAMRSLGEVGRHGRYAPEFSLQAVAQWAARVDPAQSAGTAGIVAALLVCACIALVGVNAIRARDPSAVAWFAIAAWLALPNPYPWYALWVLPVAILSLEQPPFAALWAATISITVRYLPDAFGPLPPDRQAMIALVELAPLLYALRAIPWPVGADQTAVQ